MSKDSQQAKSPPADIPLDPGTIAAGQAMSAHLDVLAATNTTMRNLVVDLGARHTIQADDMDAPYQSETAPLAEQYVTLDQIAALVNRSKKTLERKANARNSDMPEPDVEGGGGRPHEWRWAVIRPWLEKTFKRPLSERFPS